MWSYTCWHIIAAEILVLIWEINASEKPTGQVLYIHSISVADNDRADLWWSPPDYATTYHCFSKRWIPEHVNIIRRREVGLWGCPCSLMRRRDHPTFQTCAVSHTHVEFWYLFLNNQTNQFVEDVGSCMNLRSWCQILLNGQWLLLLRSNKHPTSPQRIARGMLCTVEAVVMS